MSSRLVASETSSERDASRRKSPRPQPATTSASPMRHWLGSGSCWCQPFISYEDPVTGGRVFVHKAAVQ